MNCWSVASSYLCSVQVVLSHQTPVGWTLLSPTPLVLYQTTKLATILSRLFRLEVPVPENASITLNTSLREELSLQLHNPVPDFLVSGPISCPCLKPSKSKTNQLVKLNKTTAIQSWWNSFTQQNKEVIDKGTKWRGEDFECLKWKRWRNDGIGLHSFNYKTQNSFHLALFLVLYSILFFSRRENVNGRQEKQNLSSSRCLSIHRAFVLLKSILFSFLLIFLPISYNFASCTQPNLFNLLHPRNLNYSKFITSWSWRATELFYWIHQDQLGLSGRKSSENRDSQLMAPI